MHLNGYFNNGAPKYQQRTKNQNSVLLTSLYRVILSVLDPRKCEYLKDYSLDFEHACTTTYFAS